MEEKWKWRERRRNWRRHTIMRHKQQTYSTFLRKRSDHNLLIPSGGKPPKQKKCTFMTTIHHHGQESVWTRARSRSWWSIYRPPLALCLIDRYRLHRRRRLKAPLRKACCLYLDSDACPPSNTIKPLITTKCLYVSPPLTLCRCRRKVFEKFRLWKLQFRWCMNFHLSDHSTG